MGMKSKRPIFAVCVDNTGYPASLERRKLYQVGADSEAEKHGLLRVIDESGEDYGYSARRFFVLTLPPVLEKQLTAKPSPKSVRPARRPASRKNASKSSQLAASRR